MDIYEKALALHKEHHGKMEINVKVPMETMEDLSMAYTPGVAQPCREIHNNPETVYDYTWKGNSVAVVSDGTAVLGLGDIGPAAGLPVMEGKSIDNYHALVEEMRSLYPDSKEFEILEKVASPVITGKA